MYNVYLILPSWHVDLPHNYCSSYNCSALGSGLVWGGFGWCWCPSRGGWYAIDREMCGWYPIDQEMCGWYQSIERCVDGTERKNERCLSAIRGISSQVHTNTCQCQLTMMGSRSPTNYLLGIQLFPTRPCQLLIWGYHIILLMDLQQDRIRYLIVLRPIKCIMCTWYCHGDIRVRVRVWRTIRADDLP